jgi:hypothetical protein
MGLNGLGIRADQELALVEFDYFGVGRDEELIKRPCLLGPKVLESEEMKMWESER